MHPTDGSALPKTSTILTLGQHPILLPTAARTACFFKSSTASRAHRILPPILQLEMTSTSVTATARSPQPAFLFRHLTNLPHSKSEDEDTKLPEQRRVTAQIMRNWEQHL
jgi:hypothetical protein